MPPRISLALALHNHQPVGNFGWVLADVHDAAYRPMLDALDRHPGVRLALHYTGPLLDWLRAARPDFIDRLSALVGRGQVELMGGGYYEPVLASLPQRDRLGQLRRMADEVERIAGRRPQGAWLAERVWEPDLPTSLASTGYAWTILDDNHFRAAAIPEDKLWGPYTTDDQGQILTVFGTEKGLRYGIPFGDVETVIEHLRSHATEAGDRLGTMGDDGEKFGAWPTTWEHCWGSGRWVDRFFEALEANADWLTTLTPSDWLAEHRPIGRIYVPTASYAEMGEWALPPDEAPVFGELLHRAEKAGLPEARYLRGGFWRNFQVKYREVNDLHKQMLRASGRVAEMADGPAKRQALDHLYQGQSNDCYWHGLFGGIYISHVRLATFEHLIAAEDAADRSGREAGAAVDGARAADVDLDGVDEVVLAGSGQLVVVKPTEGAGIGSWDIRAVRHALAAVMRRRPEASHARLIEHDRQVAESVADAAGGVGSIHDRVAAKEPGLAARLHYDACERRSCLVHFLAADSTPEAFARAEFEELGDFLDRPFTVEEFAGDGSTARVRLARDGHVAGRPVRVESELAIAGDRRAPTLAQTVTIENRSAEPVRARLAIEMATTMAGGGHNPAAFWNLGDGPIRHDAAAAGTGLTTLSSGNDYIGVEVVTSVSPPADAWISPIETISNSEAGFESIYQGSALALSWPLDLAPGARTAVRVDHRVTTSRDRAEDEGL